MVGGKRVSYISYGLQIVNDCDGANKAPFSMDMAGGIAIMADRGPAGDFLNTCSPNHKGQGQNILHAAGHVKWSHATNTVGGVTSVNAGGWDSNNIYTADEWLDADSDNPTLTGYGAKVAPPASTRDSVLYSWR